MRLMQKARMMLGVIVLLACSRACLGASLSWTVLTNAPTKLHAIACSADGTKLIAAPSSIATNVDISTNSGLTWARSTVSPHGFQSWTSLATSSDGVYLYAASYQNLQPGSIFCSTNGGGTWTQSITPNTNHSVNWDSIACSSDGSTIVAACYVEQLGASSIFLSTNFGNTWALTGAPPVTLWAAVVCSSNCSTIMALAATNIYSSTDMGETWVSNAASTGTTSDWVGAAASGDGTKLFAVSQLALFASTNSGATWVASDPFLFFGENVRSCIASSMDGTKLVVVEGNDYFTSVDSGNTWIRTVDNTLDVDIVACSSEGSRIFSAGATNLYAARPVQPSLAISQTNQSLALSWTSDYNFELQQSSGLIGSTWTMVSNTVSVSNNMSQVIVPMTNSQTYFRLQNP